MLNCQHYCRYIGGKAQCTCRRPGYGLRFDKRTCKDLDECVSDSVCRDDQRCINTPGSYHCVCKNGYFESNGTCGDIDECASNPDRCGPRRTCVNQIGSYACQCRSGYKQTKTDCEDIDECAYGAMHDCKETQTCVNTLGGYECKCQKGYEMSSPGYCEDIDECKNNNGFCPDGCVNFPGGFRCSCSMGYQYDLFSHRCLDIDECRKESSCNKLQDCENQRGGYSCICKDGYGLDPSEQTCVNASRLRPQSCQDVKYMEIGRADGEYELYPTRGCDSSVRIYCADLGGKAPKSYLTLPRSEDNTATSCGFSSKSLPGCPKRRKRRVKAGSTTFQRIRILMPRLYVNITDTRFATSTGQPIPYGTAVSCSHLDETGSRRFRIDLRGTGLKVNNRNRGKVKWVDWSSLDADMNVTFSRKDQVVDGVCGGRCNKCEPGGRLRLLLLDSCRKTSSRANNIQ